jgi:hypothetical protein
MPEATMSLVAQGDQATGVYSPMVIQGLWAREIPTGCRRYPHPCCRLRYSAIQLRGRALALRQDMYVINRRSLRGRVYCLERR